MMKTFKKILLTFILFVSVLLNFFSITSAATGSTSTGTTVTWVAITGTASKRSSIDAYDEILSDTSREDMKYEAVSLRWWDEFNQQVIKVIGYAINVFIVIGIVVAFIGAYKIMTSDKEETSKEWIRLVVFGIIWIIIMVSARFLAEWLVWDGGIIATELEKTSIDNQPKWARFASALYNTILYPFIKIVLYFVVWILFFMMVWKVIGFVTATDDSSKKKAGWVIIRNVIWILIVMWAKQVVESVMWKQEEVVNTKATWIDQQGPGSILNFGSIPIVTQIINWVMWLTMFIILVLILIQWYKMFMKPDDPKNRESLKKTLLYIIIWVLVIWAAYAISSVLVINNVPVITE